MSIAENLNHIKTQLPEGVTLVAVSKTKPVSDLMEAYDAGQRIFGENKIQEMVSKHEEMPKDIQWHMIGHVQRNKVKYMAPFVSCIHGVDSLRLLEEINKQALKHQRQINCLLQIKIAKEDSKFGMPLEEAVAVLESKAYAECGNVSIIGVMGMATFTSDTNIIKSEFDYLKHCFDKLKNDQPHFNTISMGMSGDYQLAIECGSTMVRIGSHIFGARHYS